MLCLNIGGGNFRENEWLNMDYPFAAQERKRDFSLIDVPHNLMKMEPFPLESDKFDVVYTSHCIEHLTDAAAGYMLKEAYRVLKSGYTFRVTCPDADIIHDLYLKDQLAFNSRLAGESKEVNMLDALCTPLIGKVDESWFRKFACTSEREELLKWISKYFDGITIGEQAMKPGAHLSWWNFDKMNTALAEIGFRKIKKSTPGGSACPDLRKPYIDKTTPAFSLYVECAK